MQQQQRPCSVLAKLVSTQFVDFSKGKAEYSKGVNANHLVGEWVDP
jgi:hypothetical protein